MLLRSLARQNRQPVAAFDAYHEGISQTEGVKLDDQLFCGLAKRLEIAESARVIITQNLHVEYGLSNGAQGTVQGIVFAPGCHPQHHDPAQRLPRCILVNCPKYKGPTFFDEPSRRTWVPIFPRTLYSPVDKDVSRAQFPLVLGWALTPWKAQSLTLDKAVVKLHGAVATPGVLFVALSRVRHPDDLMLDDDFPALSTVLKGSLHPSFKKRQYWEKLMRAKFASTVRHHMQDAKLYCHLGTHVWTADQCEIADHLLGTLQKEPKRQEEDLLQAAQSASPTLTTDALRAVWVRMQTYPYIFELAAARNELGSLALDGTVASTAPSKIDTRELSLATSMNSRWRVPIADFASFADRDRLTPALLELFALNFRRRAPRNVSFGKWHQTRKYEFPIPQPSHVGPHIACFPFFSKVGYVTFYVLRHDHAVPAALNQLFILQRTHAFDASTRETTHQLLSLFPDATPVEYALPTELKSDLRCSLLFVS